MHDPLFWQGVGNSAIGAVGLVVIHQQWGDRVSRTWRILCVVGLVAAVVALLSGLVLLIMWAVP